MSDNVTCPECLAPRWPAHPSGYLFFDHANDCTIHAAEDGRKLADLDALKAGPALPVEPSGKLAYVLACRLPRIVAPLVRPATETERLLLNVVGVRRLDSGPLEGPLWTAVVPVAGGICMRIWPELILIEEEDDYDY